MNDNSMKMKIAIYVRVSTEEQTKEGYSIEFQLKSNIDS
jgi:DNA invertase Pin-like site-specific DNA recombinase